MKRFFRRFFCITAAIFLLASAEMHCFATTNTFKNEIQSGTVFSEYDYIVGVRKLSKATLKSLDIPDTEIEKITSNEIENEILSRKKLSDDVLRNGYGYTDDEIAILRNYNGGRLEEHAELRGLTGTLTLGKPSVHKATSKEVKVAISWWWDHPPFFEAQDVVAVAWKGTYGANNGNMAIVSSKSTHEIAYRDRSNFMNHDVVTYRLTVVDVYHSAKNSFNMDRKVGNYQGTWYAADGHLTLYLEAANGSAPLTEIGLSFVYGHNVIGFTPSVSFDLSGPGIGISLGWNLTTAGRRSGRIKIGSGNWIDA